ncbi:MULTISPECIES: SbmA/BacA-like family transporter [unclassified Pseudomonas]|uniref:SbmA/BacA-like family transporter n=1 Tax=unclassified Pseudomonas TaxID=196821 RepID=UPI000B80DE93|nr:MULTISPECIES: SbmA/BacA-like family transporter [unclassified Pseudomonas]
MDRAPLDSKPLQRHESFIKNTFSILLPYWQNEERVFAWTTAAALIFLSLLAVATALIINEWYRYFYDAIQEGDIKKFHLLILTFIGIVIFSVFRSVLIAIWLTFWL